MCQSSVEPVNVNVMSFVAARSPIAQIAVVRGYADVSKPFVAAAHNCRVSRWATVTYRAGWVGSVWIRGRAAGLRGHPRHVARALAALTPWIRRQHITIFDASPAAR